MPDFAASFAMARVSLRPLPTLAAIILFAVFLSLGNWQTRRAAQKQDLQRLSDARAAQAPLPLGQDEVDALELEHRSVVLRGEWLPAQSVLLDHRQRQGVPGYQVVMPLRLQGGSRSVLVNRGWIAAGARRDRLPEVITPAGPVIVVGEARSGISRYLDLNGTAPSGPVWQNLSIDAFRRWSGLELQPIVVLQTSAAADGLQREWVRPDLGVDRHRGYALQWYSLAALVCVLFVVLTLKRRESNET